MKYLIGKLPKNPLAKGQNFEKATKDVLKLYPRFRSIFSEDSLAEALFQEHIDDLQNNYWDREY